MPTSRSRRIITELPYRTHDLYLAAYLGLQDCKFSGTVDRDDGRPGLDFLFDDREKAAKLAKLWLLQAEPHVSAFQYAGQVKRFKVIVNQGGL